MIMRDKHFTAWKSRTFLSDSESVKIHLFIHNVLVSSLKILCVL